MAEMIKRTIQHPSLMTKGKINSMDVEATAEQWAAYDSGMLIQRALPHLTAEVREFMISGTTPEEWAILFPPGKEE